MPRVAIVFCAHHKPWLMMSTLITMGLQDMRPAELFVIYNQGDGECVNRASYAEYHRLAAHYGRNPQVSNFDERVRGVCRVRGVPVTEIEFENDHALDSGAWYRFIRSERWRGFDYVLFLGEGALFTRSNSLSAMVGFAQRRDAGFVASGHEKRRLPKELVLHYNQHRKQVTPMDDFHDRMMREVYGVFRRDADFERVWQQWSERIAPETQNHVPDIWGRRLWYRVRNIADGRTPQGRNRIRTLAQSGLQRWRGLFPAYDALAATATVGMNNILSRHAVFNGRQASGGATIHVNGIRRPVRDVINPIEEAGIQFHRAEEPEWFGCTVLHLMSRTFLETLHVRLQTQRIYRVLDLPFSGTALEIVWGLLPAWLGYDKWFTNAMHRVRKNFVTYRREDDPSTMASYINRYYRGAVSVRANGERLTVKALHYRHAGMREMLPECYF